MTKYKDNITRAMFELAGCHKAKFIGYNTACGSRMYGTLEHMPLDQCIETPICENLMVGIGMGLSLEGFRAVVCFERHDFLLMALDAIINHLDKLPKLSGGQFNFPLIIRAIVGGTKPLDPGLQHIQEYTDIITKHTDIKVFRLLNAKQVTSAYRQAMTTQRPVVMVEYKDLY